MDLEESNTFIINKLNEYCQNPEKNAFMINRLGISELNFLYKYIHFFENNLHPEDESFYTLNNNAGIYHTDNIEPFHSIGCMLDLNEINYFIKLYDDYVKGMLNSIENSTGICTFRTMPNINNLQSYFTKGKVDLHSRVLEPFYMKKNREVNREMWTKHLSPFKVLIISPFVETIQQQLLKPSIKSFLFDSNQQFIFYKPYVTIAGNKPHRNWRETFEIMCSELTELYATNPFDIALLSCGGYGGLLCDYLYTLKGVSTIYIGGGLQLLFGIWGKRWDTREDIKGIFKENGLWDSIVRPSEKEVPKNKELIEGGCYW